MLCEYGCEQEAQFQLKNGKWCCSERYNSCPELKRKNSISKAGKSSEAIRRAGLLGVSKEKENAKKRKADYELNPKLCKYCKKTIQYGKTKNDFCSSKCAGYYNNPKSNVVVHISTRNKFRNIYYTNCKICDKVIVNRYSGGRMTCSRECHSIASTKIRTYPNGVRKTIYYDNPNQGRIVLESSWELEIAKLLDSMKIIWIRPKFIRWVDDLGKARIYYPDFYLSDFQVYLDPKNPFCCNQDFEKMTKITEKIHVIWGDIAIIKYYVENLLQKTE